MDTLSNCGLQHCDAVGDDGETTITEKTLGVRHLTDKVETNDETDNSVVAKWLVKNVPEFRRLGILRQKGWENNPAADKFFNKQRKTADNATPKTRMFFFGMMETIGEDLNLATQAYKIDSHGDQPRILDMCMAPGGFLSIAMKKNQNATALAFSLPVSQGGHKVLLPQNEKVEIRFLDITMLAEDMGVLETPSEHPDVDGFLPRQFAPDDQFDLAFCDGQVLRTHHRANYREKCEARRLTCTQLALSVEHLRPGGTIVVLLHKVEAWDTLLCLRAFTQFSDVVTFKSTKYHGTRSSFYMVAKNVRSQSPEASRTVGEWKRAWKFATFGLGENLEIEPVKVNASVHRVLEDFGAELKKLGEGIWKIQADALEKAPYMKPR